MNPSSLACPADIPADPSTGPAAKAEYPLSAAQDGRDRVSMSGELLTVLDFACLGSAAALATVIHGNPGSVPGLLPGIAAGTARAMLLATCLAPFILRNSLFGTLAIHGRAGELLRAHGLRLVACAGMVAAICMVTQADDPDLAGALGTWFGLALISTSLTRLILAVTLRLQQLNGRMTEAIALVGAGPRADRLLQQLRMDAQRSVEVLGVFDDRGAVRGAGAVSISGTITQLIELGKTRRIDHIVLTLPPAAHGRVQAMLSRLMTLSAPISVCPPELALPRLADVRFKPVDERIPSESTASTTAPGSPNPCLDPCWETMTGGQSTSLDVPRWGDTLAQLFRERVWAPVQESPGGSRRSPIQEPGDAFHSVTIDDFDLREFSAEAAAFGMDRFGYAVTPNVDHLIRLRDHASFRALYASASYVLLDSRFLSRLLRLSRGLRLPVCTGSDLTARLFSSVIRHEDPVVLIGGTALQAERLRSQHGLQRLVHHCPPMGFIEDPAAVEDCLRFIEAHSPFRFCLLAIGAPRQEMIAQRLLTRGVARGLALCIGASINFLTGDERRAPEWMQRTGCEWLFRLLQDPARLGHRYLVRGPRVFWLLRHTLIALRPRPGAAYRVAAAVQPLVQTRA